MECDRLGRQRIRLKDALDRIFFYRSGVVHGLYTAALQEWNLGIQYNKADLIAGALDKYHSLDVDVAALKGPWEYKEGNLHAVASIGKDDLLNALDMVVGGRKLSSTINSLQPLAKVAMPTDQPIDWSGRDNLSKYQPLSEDDVIHEIERTSKTRPSFGFAFNKSALGFTIIGVAPGSPADKAGLRTGMTIQAIDGSDISNVDAQALLSMLSKMDNVMLTVRDSSETKRFSIEKPK